MSAELKLAIAMFAFGWFVGFLQTSFRLRMLLNKINRQLKGSGLKDPPQVKIETKYWVKTLLFGLPKEKGA